MSKDKKTGKAVGYGRPPKSGQFKKGQSGNPKGRPKGSRDFNTLVKMMLTTQVTITEGGKRKRVSSLQANLMRLNEKGLKGEMRAIEKIIGLAVDLDSQSEAHSQERSMNALDREILERLKRDILKNGASKPSKGDPDAE